MAGEGILEDHTDDSGELTHVGEDDDQRARHVQAGHHRDQNVCLLYTSNLKAAEFIRDTLGENPQYKIYEKRLEYLIADKEAAHTLADEWVASIPD